MRHEVAHLVEGFLGTEQPHVPQLMVRVSRELNHLMAPFLREQVVVVVVVVVAVVVVVVASTPPTTTTGGRWPRSRGARPSREAGVARQAGGGWERGRGVGNARWDIEDIGWEHVREMWDIGWEHACGQCSL